MDATAFLTHFFGPGNLIELRSIVDGTIGSEFTTWLQPWMDDLSAPNPRPVVLPRRHPDRRLEWYALAQDERQARSLREDLLAFVGPSYSTFSGQLADLDPLDDVDAAVLEFTHGQAFR